MTEAVIIFILWAAQILLDLIARIAPINPSTWAAPVAGITCAVIGMALY